MALSIYVHIPYCLQRCRYCDFTTFEFSQIRPPEQYLELLQKEIQNRHGGLQNREIATIYFGGGTPSLVPSEHIVAILHELANAGFERMASSEITLEINPATIDARKLDMYLEHGINRFSVGAQTFDDGLLALCGRRHTAADTVATLDLLRARAVNYSFDLLFALPGQSLAKVIRDVERAIEFEPPHLSAYCLTVPEGHPMAKGRAPEDKQVMMFDEITARLARAGLEKYEISNFARPGFESRHNQAYWSDDEYWGIGLSSHSYLHDGAYGTRFWNPKDFDTYERQLGNPAMPRPHSALPAEQKEALRQHEALTDFCHIFLRTRAGLSLERLRRRFPHTAALVESRLRQLQDQGQLVRTAQGYRLTASGEVLCNRVLAELTFLPEDLAKVDIPPVTSILEA